MKFSGFNNQISAYYKKRPPKFHEIELLKLIERHNFKKKFRLLDIGCASGAFLSLITSKYPESDYCGFDISSELIQLAKSKLKDLNVSLTVNDALNFEPDEKFDFVVASGVLSIFEDLSPIKIWTDWLKEKGYLLIFGRFNSNEIDTIIRFRNHFNKSLEDSDWQGGLTSFSIKYTTEYIRKLGFKCEFIPFKYPEILQKLEDPIRTFTVDTVDNKRLILNGANILAEQYFLIISK